MRRAASFFALLAASTWAVSCDDAADRFEAVNKLRALGVAANPVVGTAASTVALTIYAAVPLGQSVTVEPFVDDASKFAPPVTLAVEPGSEAYEEHTQFRIFSLRATLTVPPIVPIPPAPGFARLRYGITFRAGGEVEKIVGTFLVYPAGDPAIARFGSGFAVDITAPTQGATVSDDEAPMIASIHNPAGEKVRVGWYVSSGKVKNRRARATNWLTKDVKGSETVLLTARGLSSGAFALKAYDVNVP